MKNLLLNQPTLVFNYARNHFSGSKSLIFLLYFLISHAAIADPIAQMTATRLSGPAPLSVLFDATMTTDTDNAIDPFRQLGYSFCFDDPGSGTWAHSGLSKNIETGGPLAAHVFDTPGVYEVRVVVRNPNGSTSEATETITVLDPDVHYSNTNTVVISTDSNFTGAPNGAQQIANATSWPAWESNKRYLLKTGDDFTALGVIRITDRSNFHLGSFGSGSKPQVTQVIVDMDEDNAATPPENGVIQGLDSPFILQRLMFNNLLVYQNDVIGNGANIVFTSANTWYAVNQRGTSSPSDWKQPGSIFIVENHVNMLGDPTGYLNAIAGLAHHVAVLGNTSEQAKEHTLRIFGTYKSVIGHNLLSGPATDNLRTDFKLMSNGINDWPADHAIFNPGTTTEVLPNTRYVRIHNNIFGRAGAPHSWHLQVAPQDDGNSNTVEGLRDIIIENNEFIDGNQDDGLERGIQTLGNNIIERGNEFPASWTQPVLQVNYPSNYSAYSALYTPFWHGPYYLDDMPPVVMVDPCSTLGTDSDPFNLKSELKAYPNPLGLGDDLTIKLSTKLVSGSLEVFDILGHMIYTQKMTQNTTDISGTLFKEGIYLVVIKTDQGRETKKIVVLD
ncbi:T9SS type A sorting domain-containing protein [Flavivirga rizhaonensis]|uniref:T9SS type A sorting domain-containing protein n=1 Tax=Flavivirga rizhaonensis TaxID=2559571 RepID=A0A4S1DU13_9FLAO|nr:T9SS type A sorting domain-containing protein [Flavivirga rizhaonensis]TGV01540.1 T9SS type A sorting domain-containing protein [Flavivirga rizhaonensis]